jgi:hypothetical protein
MRTPPIPKLTFVHIAKVLIEFGITSTPTLLTGTFITFMASEILPPVVIDLSTARVLLLEKAVVAAFFCCVLGLSQAKRKQNAGGGL